MSTFSLDFGGDDNQPLAAKMRPKGLEDYIGQHHLLAENKPLYRAIKQGHLHSMIFWGAPGTGKTTLAEIIARSANAEIERLSAVTSGVKEIREAIDRAKQNRFVGKRTLLFVDEVHRFNKSQQDAFLPFIEDGTIIFIGATTENPSFELNSALLSRVRVYLLKSLTREEIDQVVQHALHDKVNGLGNNVINWQEECYELFISAVNGDARYALNLLEILADSAEQNENGKLIIDLPLVEQVIGGRTARFDNKGDRFYDFISAFHKSVRGSAPDAALYWFARIITAGGDPLYVARRLLAIASEDIGNADPQAMRIALAAWDCYTRVGKAEGERAIAQAIIYLSCAAKSNAVYSAFKAAIDDAKTKPDYDVPAHLCNAPTELMRSLNKGAEYRYAHDEENAYAAGENYFPSEMKSARYYYPTQRGLEKKIAEKLNWLKQQDDNSTKKRY